MNLNNLVKPVTRMSDVYLESVTLGNTALSFRDGCVLPKYDSTGIDTVGPANPTLFATATIAANDDGLARFIISGKSDSKYESHDHATNRYTAVVGKFKFKTPIVGGCIAGKVNGGSLSEAIVGDFLILKDYVALSEHNWKLVASGTVTGARYVYGRIVGKDGVDYTVDLFADPYKVTLA